MANKRKKWKIYQEDAKTQQTSHWDWDYMSAKEMDALMRAAQHKDQQVAEEQAKTNRKQKARLFKIIVGVGVIVLVSSGILLSVVTGL